MTLLLGVTTKSVCSLSGSLCSMGFVLGMLFLGVGFVFSLSPRCREHITECSWLQPRCLKSDLPRSRHLLSVHCVLGGSAFSPGASSYWAEAYTAPGPGDSGLPNSLHPTAPQRPSGKCVPGHMVLVETDMGMTWGARILPQRKTLNPFSFVKIQRKKFKAFRKPHPPRFRRLCDYVMRIAGWGNDVRCPCYMDEAGEPKHENNSSHILVKHLKHASHYITCVS